MVFDDCSNPDNQALLTFIGYNSFEFQIGGDVSQIDTFEITASYHAFFVDQSNNPCEMNVELRTSLQEWPDPDAPN